MENAHYAITTLIKVVLVLVLAMIALFVGLMIGYGVIGDGNGFDVFKPSIWHHILDFVQ
jgi:hypothetical protein